MLRNYLLTKQEASATVEVYIPVLHQTGRSEKFDQERKCRACYQSDHV